MVDESEGKGPSFGEPRKLSSSSEEVTFRSFRRYEAKESSGNHRVLKSPKFQKLGGRIPKGVLRWAPGNRHTRCSRARFAAKPSAFFDQAGRCRRVLVGVGASPSAIMFEQGKKTAPMYSLHRRIRAVVRPSRAGLGGGPTSASRTLTQSRRDGRLRVERRGLLVAATPSRLLVPGMMRPGLLSPLVVNRPDVKGAAGSRGAHQDIQLPPP